MKQPIPGVVDPETNEVEVQTIWPSIAGYRSGQWMGKLFAIQWPNIYIFRMGNLFALLSIPYALILYFYRVSPVVGIRYRVTNRRVTICRGLSAQVEQEIKLSDFDHIEVTVPDGLAWYHAGDLVFQKDGQEVFRLKAVCWPDVFAHNCMGVRQAVVGVQQIREKQSA